MQKQRHEGIGRNSSQYLIHNTSMKIDSDFLIFKNVFLSF